MVLLKILSNAKGNLEQFSPNSTLSIVSTIYVNFEHCQHGLDLAERAASLCRDVPEGLYPRPTFLPPFLVPVLYQTSPVLVDAIP